MADLDRLHLTLHALRRECVRREEHELAALVGRTLAADQALAIRMKARGGMS